MHEKQRKKRQMLKVKKAIYIHYIHSKVGKSVDTRGLELFRTIKTP